MGIFASRSYTHVIVHAGSTEAVADSGEGFLACGQGRATNDIEDESVMRKHTKV